MCEYSIGNSLLPESTFSFFAPTALRVGPWLKAGDQLNSRILYTRVEEFQLKALPFSSLILTEKILDLIVDSISIELNPSVINFLNSERIRSCTFFLGNPVFRVLTEGYTSHSVSPHRFHCSIRHSHGYHDHYFLALHKRLHYRDRCVQCHAHRSAPQNHEA